MDKKIENYDVVIIGGGAAGLTAAIYAGRARLKTLLIEKALVGGLATYTNEIENYPGFPGGGSGLGLMELFHKHSIKFGVDFKFTDVKRVNFEGATKRVETFRNIYDAKVVIVASGGKPRLTGTAREDEFLYDKGISFCATCDAAANEDKIVMVIGSGDAAIEEGVFLTKFAKKVIVSVIHDEGKMDCNEVAKSVALSNPKMEFIWNTAVDSFSGHERLSHVNLRNLKTGDIDPVQVDTCFLFIGYLPNTELFEGMLDMTPGRYLVTNERMETNVPGVFAAGDVRDKYLKQVVTAAGDGAIAGYAAEKYIAESEIFENRIMNGGKPSLVYLYNASEAASRDILPLFKKLSHDSPADGMQVTVVDVYKSDGIARRLDVDSFPRVVLLNGSEREELREGDISPESVAALIESNLSGVS